MALRAIYCDRLTDLGVGNMNYMLLYLLNRIMHFVSLYRYVWLFIINTAVTLWKGEPIRKEETLHPTPTHLHPTPPPSLLELHLHFLTKQLYSCLIKHPRQQYKDSHVKDNTVSRLFIFNMIIPIPGKDGLYIEMGPSAHVSVAWTTAMLKCVHTTPVHNLVHFHHL